jgi:hypothetical protein
MLLLMLYTVPAQAQELAFPEAEGFGRYTVGGRGGTVMDVTILADSGPGSLRQCAEVTSGPRICRLAVNGTAVLTNDITIRHAFVTIEPAPGVQFAIKNGGIDVRASQTILRHFRIRPGNYTYATYGRNANGITYRSTENSENTSDHIADHLSISWGTDDLINVVFGTDRVTIQWSILSEGYVTCGQSCGGKGFLMGYGARNVSFHHNLSAHNWIRWPEYTGGSDVADGNLDFVNNVHYNGNGTDTIMWSYHGPQFANFIGNYWKQGLDGPATKPLNQGYPAVRTIGQQTYTARSGIFVQDNYGRYAPVNCPGCDAVVGLAAPDDRILWEDNGGIPHAPARYPYPLVTTTSALHAYDDVLAGVGAFPRDAVDVRVLADVQNGTGHWINDAADVGGWPTLTGDTTAPPLPPPSSPQTPPTPSPVADVFFNVIETETTLSFQWKKLDCPGGVSSKTTGTTTKTRTMTCLK